MKKNEDELEKKCTCGCNDKCECDENCECGCQDGEECTCHECNCNEDCDCCCGCDEFPPLEEKLVLAGVKGEKETEKAIEFLDKKKIDYAFLDLEEGKEDVFNNLNDKIEVPTLLLLQTVVAGIASGLEEIEESFEN